ncbi:GNAT family N-acetyltransferase [Emticicia sp. TH156]|uniref:GNAT family N-acetyltransferase n=1 Tax=Emticicia sp. TH156 TaxID=2067454 RepID=UPI001E34D87A|nr:GNAT family N-acetyltransferase [Emticicia sp. TH156]
MIRQSQTEATSLPNKLIELKQIQAEDTRQLRHKVMWPDQHPDFVVLPNDAEGLHYGLLEDGKLVSVVSLFRDGHQAQFRKFATDTAMQGRGYGTQLLQYMIEQALAMGIKELWCDARVTAIGFYERFGMKADSAVFQKNGKDYVCMGLDLTANK